MHICKNKLSATFVVLWWLLSWHPIKTQTLFEDITEQAGLHSPGTNQGVAFADFDGDGWLDLLVTRSQLTNLLYRNRGDGRFEEVAEEMGVAVEQRSGMPVWGDFDNDADPDLYLAMLSGPNRMFENRPGQFVDVTNAAGVGDSHFTEALGLVDLDRDGNLDIFVFNRGGSSSFFQNHGDWRFSDILSSAEIASRSNAMGLAWGDYDNDGDQDLYLVYDGHQPNNLFRNNGDQTFSDVAADAGADVAAEGMAAAFGDYDNDGDLDLYITNMFENVLLQNNGDGTFTDMSETAGVADRGMGWSLTWLDYDNDGWLDLYVVNASSFTSPASPNVLYYNNRDGTFSIINNGDVSESLLSGYGGACGDIDNDGFVDLFVINEGRSSQLFRNLGNDKHWLAIELIGTVSTRDAIGARVSLTTAGKTQIREIAGGSGWFSQNTRLLHFGLGEADRVDEIVVNWPSGITESLNDVPADQRMTLIEGDVVSSVPPVAADIPQQFRLSGGYPNPFSAARAGASFTIEYEITAATGLDTRIFIYNLRGQVVKRLLAHRRAPGQYSLTWDGTSDAGRRVADGPYFIRMSTAGEAQTLKILVVD